MSSGTPSDPRGANQAVYGIANATLSGAQLARLSPRQVELRRRYAHFRCATYDDRTVDWNGDPIVGPQERAAVAREQAVPPGFYDPYGQTLPLTFRRPDAPYYLGAVVVHRFTGLLFGEGHHPRLSVPGDAQTEDWLIGAAEAGRLWPQMVEARNLGGAMGTVALGFSLVDGTVVFEVHDASLCNPTFKNRATQELKSIEIRYTYKDYLRDETGGFLEVEFWSRRVIDEKTDTVWEGVAVTDEEPPWDQLEPTSGPVVHGFGFVPVEWVQNRRIGDDPDGDPDCHGAFDTFERIDALNAQANRGIIASCDPTLVVATDGEVGDPLKKGAGNYIYVGKGESADYLEMTGAGSKIAMEQADRLEEKALRMVRCVIEQARSFKTKTATEVEKDYSAMHEAGDTLREQYGERGVKRLLTKLLRAARALAVGTVDETTGQRVVQEIILPPKVEESSDGTVKVTPRKLGNSSYVELKWPPYTRPSATDTGAMVDAAAKAVDAGLVDRQHGAQTLAPMFGVEDVDGMLEAMDAAKAKADGAFADATTGAITGGRPSTDESVAKFFQYEIDAGIVTVDELRASKGLPPLSQDGDLTVPQYRVKYADTFAKATMTANEVGAEKVLGVANTSTPPASSVS